jgi:hypothetical protein
LAAAGSNSSETRVIAKLLIGWGLMALCVVIHAFGIAAAMRWLAGHLAARLLWSRVRLFITLAGGIVLLHMIEIAIWGWFFAWVQAMPDQQAAFYFSAVTYTTTGYGDLVLPQEWRLVGAIEALTGILMCGWSTGFFFAIVSRMFKTERDLLESSS